MTAGWFATVAKATSTRVPRRGLYVAGAFCSAVTLRELEASLGREHTPIIALTANAMQHQVAEYAAAGMDGFVAKPIDIARLLTAIQEALGEGDENAPEDAPLDLDRRTSTAGES